MLKELYIENLAIIEKAVISFESRLNVFTGETGAGKSILIGGINAVLGGRVSKDIVRAGAERAVVSGLFDDIPLSVREKLAEYGYDSDDELLLMREVGRDGKSTARINGRTATVAVLKEVAAGLIDIHGQHDSRMLMDSAKQRDILDSYSGLSEKLSAYAACFREFSALSRRIKSMQSEGEVREAKAALLKEKIAEVKAIDPRRGEEAEIAEELGTLRNAEEIERGLNDAYYALEGDGNDFTGAVDLVNGGANGLLKLAAYIPACAGLSERLMTAAIELDDIKTEISARIPDGSDLSRLPRLEERMSDFLRLKRKYGKDMDEILDDFDRWRDELAETEYSDDRMEALFAERKRLADSVKSMAAEITALRREAGERLTRQITDELVYLDMPSVRLVFDITQQKVTVNGMDNVDMLISVNRGEEPKPMGKIASGGELSRIMLAIKSVLADNDDIPTMIFDEIDTGISGRAAHKVGVKLAGIAAKRQVLCVTHLAQIAAMADRHLLIEKSSDDARTYTEVRAIDREARRRELARIISGGESELSVQNAEALIRQAEEIKKENGG